MARTKTLTQLIDAAGKGYTKLAEDAGMSPRTLLAMRDGDDRIYRVATIANLARALGVEPAVVRAAIEKAKRG